MTHPLARIAASRWTHQLVAFVMVVVIALAFHRWGSTHLPPARLFAGDVAYGLAFIGWGLAFLGFRFRTAKGMDSEDAWYAYLLTVLWLFSLLGVTLFWIQAAYADPDRRIVSMLVCAVLISASAIVTVRPPSRGPKRLGAAIVPMVVPFGTIVYYFAHRDAQLGLVVPLLALYCALMLALREFMQGQLNTAHGAVLAAQAEQRAAQDAKARFLASASHDLDQPVHSARLYFEQLMRSEDAGERRKAARGLEWALDAIGVTVAEVTSHLKLDAGAITARHEPVSLNGVISEAVEINEPAARLRKVALRTLPTSLAVIGDPHLIERVLGNYIGNAIRHAGARRILVGAKRQQGRVRLWVIDDGCGIAAADRATLFDAYVQGSDHRGEIRGGYGLGLASVRMMAGLMHGSAGHDPRWMQGSAFFLELPAA